MSEAITIELPFPDKALSANGGHGNRYALGNARKKARKSGYECALVAGVHLRKWEGRFAIHWTFHRPASYRYDDDGLEHRMKSYRDGVANAMGVDDNCFTATRSFGENIKGGKVILTITEIGEGA